VPRSAQRLSIVHPGVAVAPGDHLAVGTGRVQPGARLPGDQARIATDERKSWALCPPAVGPVLIDGVVRQHLCKGRSHTAHVTHSLADDRPPSTATDSRTAAPGRLEKRRYAGHGRNWSAGLWSG
jgi:hypothetical protein